MSAAVVRERDAEVLPAGADRVQGYVGEVEGKQEPLAQSHYIEIGTLILASTDAWGDVAKRRRRERRTRLEWPVGEKIVGEEDKQNGVRLHIGQEFLQQQHFRARVVAPQSGVDDLRGRSVLLQSFLQSSRPRVLVSHSGSESEGIAQQ